MKSDHVAILQSRPMIKGKLWYEIKCSCGRRTPVGTRKEVQQDQKQHRKRERGTASSGVRTATPDA